ncbi:LPXTG cell wall anchor domain-containing protein [Streptomyces sp. NPDC015127]|uniref:LPXTG cell wall anchor domain-containing protein n=1 Tax=Streptomyces sp. NPDC015127 TaxID=3364939 RepID=UPI0036FD3FA2
MGFDVRAGMRRALGVVTAAALLGLGAQTPAQAETLPGENAFAVGNFTISKESKVGDEQPLHIAFKNRTDKPVENAMLILKTGPGLKFLEKFSNCEYAEQPRGYSTRFAICSFKGLFEPGKAYQTDQVLTLATTPEAYTDFWIIEAQPDTPALREKARGDRTYRPGSGPELALTETPTFKESWSEDAVDTHDNTADFGVTGDKATGAPGSTLTMEPTWRNNGPASISEPWDSSTVGTIEITLPKGVSMVDSPCRKVVEDGSNGTVKGDVWYSCGTGPGPWQVMAGQQGTIKATLKIDKKVRPGTLKGTVKWTTRYIHHHMGLSAFDNTPANNSAPLVFEVTGDGTPTPSPSGTPTASPSPSSTATAPAATPSPTSPARPTATSTPAAGGNLASTGSSALTVGSLAALAVALGGGLWLWARRRRTA